MNCAMWARRIGSFSSRRLFNSNGQEQLQTGNDQHHRQHDVARTHLYPFGTHVDLA
jgi:hypothetical protein